MTATIDWTSINFKTEAGLSKLNGHLSQFSYITGNYPSQDDVIIAKKVSVPPPKAQYVHAARWFKHIAYFGDKLKATWPKGAMATEKKAEEEEIDLFGDDGGVDAKSAVKAASDKVKAAKEPKKAVIAKSTLVFEIKPASEKTNLDVIEKEVRKITMEGLEWAPASKKIPVAFGLFKLQIGGVIVDDLVETESILEKIECIGLSEEEAAAHIAKRNRGDDDDEDEDEEEDDDAEGPGMVQSAEIVSFQKV